MNLDRRVLGEKAKEMGFVRDTLEKVYRLTEVLEFINSDSMLSENLILKGGTAINLTVFDLPRLSVDIDLDLAINYSLEEMLKVRETITEKFFKYMKAKGYTLNPRSKSRHSLDSWVYSYTNTGGNADNIKIEINYSLRAHIFDSVLRPVVTILTETELKVKTLVPSELFASKLNALINRAAVRDLYDINNLIKSGLFVKSENSELRKNTVFYSAISAEKINKDFKTDAIDDITFAKVKRDLFPVIAKQENFELEQRKESAKVFIKELMILTDKEIEFLDRFEKKEYRPDLVFDDEKIIARLEKHPMAIWKMGK